MCCIPSYSFLGNGTCSSAAGVWSPTRLRSSVVLVSNYCTIIVLILVIMSVNNNS